MTIAINIMAINKISFVITTPRNIHFGTAELVHDKTKKTIMTSIKQVVQAYKVSGFKEMNILGDWGFECTRRHLEDKGITLYVTSQDEHVTEVEWYFWTIKETVRAITSKLPFEKFPPWLIAEMVYNVVFWMNSFLMRTEHVTISPWTLITRLTIDHNKHC